MVNGTLRKATAASVLFCGACQVYTPVTAATPSTGTAVRITLTEQGTASLYGPLGTGARQIEGSVHAVSDSTITLAVTSVERLNGADEQWNGETYAVPRNDIATVERKQTSVSRSVIVVAAIVGAAYLATKSGSSGDVSGVPTPGAPQGGH